VNFVSRKNGFTLLSLTITCHEAEFIAIKNCENTGMASLFLLFWGPN
jgi:hypothetical protein